jgi:hypothetical protein
MDEDEFMDCIAPYCDTIIRVEEDVDPLKKNLMKAAKIHLDSFSKQVDIKIKNCTSEEEKDFVYMSTLTFLMVAMKKICREQQRQNKLTPDGLVTLAKHLHDGIIDIAEEDE